MAESPYQQMQVENLSLRDRLAIDRTALANERTLLAYVRTSLATIVTGASLLHFFDSWLLRGLGSTGLLAGVLILAVGIRSFQQSRRNYAHFSQDEA